MRAAVALAAVAFLAACSAGDALVRDQAKSAVNTVVAKRFPGVNAAPVTDCVIDNATTGEVLTIARGAKFGVTDETVRTVTDVLGRRSTLDCVTRNGLALLGAA